ncbi:unnamed protein product [Rotaria sp. Silwood2]|nr:unnamed protein product [Rotaria sp. Silwood2]CAF2943133.1 unnamed protein product [Rotaria sp. Silwood2]CAF3331724.1 unnamed protein product [Rotaria sp. Silwood2]CAF4362855.1 unnamed protein product [Rotaria sp. Silwood2]CAF4365716.1 unnamed protein product [Rotaria sp. Silwood2]
MLQGIPTEDNATYMPRPFLLSAYGINNKITAMEVLNRWMYIFRNCLDKGVRLIGFSTDADRRYVSAMRLASGFFASLSDLQLDKHQHGFKIDIPKHWKWFFLRQNQLFLFFQDPVHLVTKWRNRLLSSTANLCFGIDKISISQIEALINDSQDTKLDHGLTNSDINPKRSAKLSLMLKQHDLPKQALLGVHLFNSQPCESIFRDARSLSGSFSTIVNFTVNNFIRRSQKLSILNQIKYDQSENNLCFPLHYKHKHDDSLTSPDRLDEIDTLDVELVISNAYNQAINIVKHSKMLQTLTRNGITDIDNLGEFVFDSLRKTSKMFGHSSQATIDHNEELESDDDEHGDEDDEDNDMEDDGQDDFDEILSDFKNEDCNDDAEVLNSTRANFNGIKIVDNINPMLKSSYFKLKINDKIKYLHKQSACWLLSNTITKLSSDRLTRVMQQTTNNSS